MKHFLKDSQVKKLRKAHRRAKQKGDAHGADKIKSILLLNDCYSYEQIAKILLLDDSTIRRYADLYEKEGLKGLTRNNYTGGTSSLSQEQEVELIAHLESHTYHRAKDIARHIKETYGITYSEKGVVYLLHRLGFVYKKPKRIPGKADPEKQIEFIEEKYKKIKEKKGPHDRIYFMDATHPHHNPEPVCGWIKKGTTKEIRSNTGRNRLNINGAIDITDFNMIFREDTRINAQSTIELFKQMEEANPLADIIFVISDNARYYRAKNVTDYLARSKIELVFLPPYAPNLNLIERLWRFLRKKVLCHYYETFAEFRMACLSFFENLHDYKEQLATLLTENFEITGKNFSQTCLS